MENDELLLGVGALISFGFSFNYLPRFYDMF